MNLSHYKEYYDLGFRPDLNIFICRWFKMHDFSDIKSCYERIFNDIINGSSNSILLDIRGRGKTPIDVHEWYFNEFLPSITAKLTQPLTLAYLLAPSHYSYVVEIGSIKKLEVLEANSLFKSKAFQEEQLAINWLTQNT